MIKKKETKSKHANKFPEFFFPDLLKIDGNFYEMRLTHTSARLAGIDDVCAALGMCGGRMAESDG